MESKRFSWLLDKESLSTNQSKINSRSKHKSLNKLNKINSILRSFTLPSHYLRRILTKLINLGFNKERFLCKANTRIKKITKNNRKNWKKVLTIWSYRTHHIIILKKISISKRLTCWMRSRLRIGKMYQIIPGTR